jgi:hypothetical protein
MSEILSQAAINYFYAGIGVILTIFSMIIGYYIFDKFITTYNTQKELDDGNISVGIVVGCLLLAIGYASATVIAAALN